MNVERFLEGCGELSLAKVTMLKYLQKVSDKFDITPAPKGRSRVECRFDCGVYKGEEVLTFRVADLNPIFVAAKLLLLTSGHHFSFDEGEETLLQEMKKSLAKRNAA